MGRPTPRGPAFTPALRLAIALLGVLLPSADNWAETHTGRAVEVRGRLLVDVFLNGAGPYPFLLDAAIQRPVLDPGVAEYLGLAVAKDPAVADTGLAAPVAYISTFQFAAGLQNDETAPLLPLDALSARLGKPIAGLLPAYQAGLEVTFQFNPPGVAWRTLDASALQDAADAVALRIDAGGLPTFDALLDGRAARRLGIDLDIGEDLALSRRTLADLGVTEESMLEIRFAGGGTVRQARIQSLKVGTATLDRPWVRVADGPDVVGLGFLRRFGVTLNFEFGRMHLATAGGNALRPPIRGYGIVLDGMVDGQWLIGVAVGSPADAAGLLPGDHLVSIDGQRLHGATAAQVEERLAADDEDRGIALTVHRLGEPITVELRPAPLLGG